MRKTNAMTTDGELAENVPRYQSMRLDGNNNQNPIFGIWLIKEITRILKARNGPASTDGTNILPGEENKGLTSPGLVHSQQPQRHESDIGRVEEVVPRDQKVEEYISGSSRQEPGSIAMDGREPGKGSHEDSISSQPPGRGGVQAQDVPKGHELRRWFVGSF